jgi:transcriptional regulator with XRE-family HTH domain
MAGKRHRLAARRRLLGFTQESLAERLGVDASTVKRWESGRTGGGPQPWVRRGLAECLEISLEELEALLADDPPVLPWVAGHDEDDVDRRALLKLLGGAAMAAPFAGHLEHLRRGIDAALGGPTTPADVEEWERTALRYAHEVGHLPYADVFPSLLTDLAELHVRLMHASDALHPRMAHVCGQLSAFMAIILFDKGDPGGARRYWRTAVRAADESGDLALRSHIRAKRAVYALYEPSALPALTLSEEAIAVGKGAPRAGVVSGQAVRSQALALLGRHDDARRALGDLADTFAHLPESTVADCISEWGWSEQRLYHVQSWVHSHAGRLKEAAIAQEAALARYPASAFRGPAQVQLHRAMCVITAGDPSEGALQAIRSLEALPHHCRDNAVIRRTAALALGAIPDRARTLPAVAEARELLALPPGQA